MTLPFPADRLAAWLAQHQPALESRWFEWLRIPSIATEPVHHPDCCRCAAWLRDELSTLGFRSMLIETCGQPVVFAERPADREGGPTVLLYGHYDVQPADPLEAWSQPDPFEPVLRGDRIFARGAQDNKGQLFFALQALRALQDLGIELPHVKIVVEGEEECGSHGLAQALRQDAPGRFAADLLVVCDTGMAADGRPAVVAGLRGMVQWNVVVEGADYDLHSGQHGGLAPNAVTGLARLLSTLHDDRGRILVEGFLEGLETPDEEECAVALRMPFDPVAYRQAIGVAPVGGERDFAPQIRLGFRPTLEVNGFHGGYGGPGVKTIIPARAEAKLSARLGPGQTPGCCMRALERHLHRFLPEGLRLRVEGIEGGLPGIHLPLRTPALQLARSVLDTLDPRGSVVLWEGASIPIVRSLVESTGAEPLLVGFGLEADRIHAPNESFSRAQARMEFLFAGQLFARLGQKNSSCSLNPI